MSPKMTTSTPHTMCFLRSRRGVFVGKKPALMKRPLKSRLTFVNLTRREEIGSR